MPAPRSPQVFLLWHVHTLDPATGEDDVKLLGAYSTRPLAVAAKRRLGRQPGFRETPRGFEISAYRLDEDQWTAGFVTASRPARLPR